MHRRTALHGVAVSFLGATSGCASLSDLTGSVIRPDGPPEVAGGPGDYPHPIEVTNESSRERTLTLTVESIDGSVLYEGTHTVAAGTEQVVAGFTQKAVQREHKDVRVVVTVDGVTEEGQFTVDSCHGSMNIEIGSDGDIHLFYAIC